MRERVLRTLPTFPRCPDPQVTELPGAGMPVSWSCGRRVRGRHPDVGPDQYGASAHRVGRRVMAAAHMLHYGVGIPVRRVPVGAQSADGCGVEPGSDHAGRSATSDGALWGMRTTGFGSLCLIARKVSHCSRNEAGADAFSAFTSVIRTLARHGGGQPAVDGLCGVFRGAPVHTCSI